MITTVKLALGLAPYVLAPTLWALGRLRDRRALVRDSELRAAIARHPSMHRTQHAIYQLPCCGETVIGVDPMDLLGKQLHHEALCLGSERAA